jgi:RimJ/RimL family protein N-acetyltransferase
MIETERLILKPLNYDQLVKYLNAHPSLEEELSVNYAPRLISSELKEALEQTILPAVSRASGNYLYSTLWTIISKADKRMVGDLCIIGEPNDAGEIEIGYGTYDEFRGKGFMTEAVGCIIKWAEQEPNVKAVIASTAKENFASFRVLLKNGFQKTGESETMFYWKRQFGK